MRKDGTSYVIRKFPIQIDPGSMCRYQTLLSNDLQTLKCLKLHSSLGRLPVPYLHVTEKSTYIENCFSHEY